MLTATRRQGLAYRIAAQGLHRGKSLPADVLTLGLQYSNAGLAVLALAARSAKVPAPDALAGKEYATAWTFRGAPHVHLAGSLPELAAALWPVSDADAMSRLAAERVPLKAAGIGGLEAFTTAAKAMRKVVTKPMAKGAVSTGVTKALPPAYSYECRGCQATHVYVGLFQSVGVSAGVLIEPGSQPLTLQGFSPRPAIPPGQRPGPAELILAYLRVHGPAKPADAAGFLGTTATAIREHWPAEALTEVSFEGVKGKTWIPSDSVDQLAEPPEPPPVRLLPPLDPFVQSRDRSVLVPDRQLQKEVWRILGNPGVLLAEGEIAGTWRARMSGKARLAVAVESFSGFSSRTKKQIEEEAAGVAAARGAPDVTVTFES